jgi:hypothetical protein
MAGIRGKSAPPGNQNAFRHGLAGISSMEKVAMDAPLSKPEIDAGPQRVLVPERRRTDPYIKYVRLALMHSFNPN